LIFIEHDGEVWYNYNRHRNGRNLAPEPQVLVSADTQKSIILHHKSQFLKHFGVLMNKKHIFRRPKTHFLAGKPVF
jgi:hypothetical protein